MERCGFDSIMVPRYLLTRILRRALYHKSQARDPTVTRMSASASTYVPTPVSCPFPASPQQIRCSGRLHGTPRISKILLSLLPSTNVPCVIRSLFAPLMTSRHNPR